jgi:hypothetical protein
MKRYILIFVICFICSFFTFFLWAFWPVFWPKGKDWVDALTLFVQLVGVVAIAIAVKDYRRRLASEDIRDLQALVNALVELESAAMSNNLHDLESGMLKIRAQVNWLSGLSTENKKIFSCYFRKMQQLGREYGECRDENKKYALDSDYRDSFHNLKAALRKNIPDLP